MGLSYLNKKNWHPEKFQNIEKVTLANIKNDEDERKKNDRIKKLREERRIEDLKRVQVEQGLIPKGNLDRMDWMYDQAIAAEQTVEDYLLGKPIDEKTATQNQEKPTEKALSDDENEAFARNINDPLTYIREQESLKKEQTYNDPVLLKKI